MEKVSITIFPQEKTELVYLESCDMGVKSCFFIASLIEMDIIIFKQKKGTDRVKTDYITTLKSIRREQHR